MKLQAARDDGREERVGRRRGQDKGGGAGGLFENFQEDVGDVPAHGFGAVKNENAAASHGLKVRGTLNGAKLSDAKHGTGDGTFQTDGVGNERPDVGMGLQDERDAFDGGGVCAFAAFGEALLDEFFWIGEKSDALAGFALAARIVGQALAVGGLGKQARESELADAARAAEKKGMRNALAAQSAAERGDDAFIAEEFGEAHGLAAVLPERAHENLQDGGENFRGDFFLRAHGAKRFVKTGNGGPIGAARELIVHCGGLFEMTEAGFLQVLLDVRVAAGGLASNQLLGLARRDAKIEDQGFAREIVNVVFEMFDPGDERGTIGGGSAGRLMGEVRGDVAVGEDDSALSQSDFQMRLGFEAIARIEQGAEMRVNGFEVAEIAVEKLADHFAEPGIVLGKACGINDEAARDESFFEQIDLSALAAAVDAFEGDEFSRGSHIGSQSNR